MNKRNIICINVLLKLQVEGMKVKNLCMNSNFYMQTYCII